MYLKAESLQTAPPPSPETCLWQRAWVRLATSQGTLPVEGLLVAADLRVAAAAGSSSVCPEGSSRNNPMCQRPGEFRCPQPEEPKQEATREMSAQRGPEAGTGLPSEVQSQALTAAP